MGAHVEVLMMARPVPTYHRPDHLAKVVKSLNDYYEQLSIIKEQDAEVRALAENAHLLMKNIRTLRDEPCLPMVAGYGRERVQSSPAPEKDPFLKMLEENAQFISDMMKDHREMIERMHTLMVDNAKRKAKLIRIQTAIMLLSPLQRQVIEARHRDGIKCMVLSKGLKYEPISIRSAYHRALHRLAEVI